MKQELVSAIITTHNRPPEFLLRALNSVLNQTYKMLEIIVVDDSTPDFSQRDAVELAVRNASPNVLYIKHTKNLGVCAARNTGLAHAHGYYVAFLDDDDEWLPEKIEEQLKGFTDEDIALVYSSIVYINEVKNEIHVANTNYKRGFVFDTLLRRNIFAGTSNPLMKKECVDKVGGFDLDMQSCEDYDLYLRLTMYWPVNYIKKPLLNYYMHKQDHISTDWNRQIAGTERIYAKYGYYIDKNRESWLGIHGALIRFYVLKCCRKKAFSIWLRCVKKYPSQILNHIKKLLLIVFGYDSLLCRLYNSFR